MSVNNANPRGEFLQFAVPTTVKSGDAILVGKLACVAQESENPGTGYPETGSVSVALIGAFFFSVHAVSTISPAVNVAIKPGDPIYYDGGTLDAPTNVTTGGTLDVNSGETLFGHALDALASGTTGKIRVRLKVGQ